MGKSTINGPFSIANKKMWFSIVMETFTRGKLILALSLALAMCRSWGVNQDPAIDLIVVDYTITSTDGGEAKKSAALIYSFLQSFKHPPAVLYLETWTWWEKIADFFWRHFLGNLVLPFFEGYYDLLLFCVLHFPCVVIGLRVPCFFALPRFCFSILLFIRLSLLTSLRFCFSAFLFLLLCPFASVFAFVSLCFCFSDRFSLRWAALLLLLISSDQRFKLQYSAEIAMNQWIIIVLYTIYCYILLWTAIYW